MARTAKRSRKTASRPETDLDRIARRCRAAVKRSALMAAVAAAVPIPGLDLAVDIGVMMKMMEEINAAFGLTHEQIEALAPGERITTYQAIAAVGSSLIGRVITRQALVMLLRGFAKRLVAATLLRYVPLAGQAVAAGISYSALKYIGNRHVADCVAVSKIIAGRG